MSSIVRKNLGETWMYEFQCRDFNLVEEVLSLVKDTVWQTNKMNLASKDSNFFHNGLYNWFDSCINEVRKDLTLPQSISLPITICWANKTSKLQNHHLHYHNNSFMSGIFYLTDGHQGGDTVFVSKNLWFKQYEWLAWPGMDTSISTTYTPKKGTLLLFPSHINHKVSTIKDNSTRYSIAFNTFLSGNIDSSDNYKTKLILKPNTVRDDYN